MQTHIEPSRSRPPILRRVGAGLVLIIAAALAVKLIIGFVMAVFVTIVVVAVVIAILWAIKTLVW
jgi:hypothetical protein